MKAKVWIDASYEGDLAAAAKVPYRTERESTREYGERFAGVIFFDQGRILPGSTGASDPGEQCANFRIIMTKRPANLLAVPKPANYSREEFAKLIPHFRSGRITEIFTEDHSGILRLTYIPNEKSRPARHRSRQADG